MKNNSFLFKYFLSSAKPNTIMESYQDLERYGLSVSVNPDTFRIMINGTQVFSENDKLYTEKTISVQSDIIACKAKKVSRNAICVYIAKRNNSNCESSMEYSPFGRMVCENVYKMRFCKAM